MSFDLLLTVIPTLPGVKVDEIPRALMESLFGPYKSAESPEFWHVTYPEGGGAELSLESGEEISFLCFNRPGGVQLFEAILEILTQTMSVVYWGTGWAYARPDILTTANPQFIVDINRSPGKLVHSAAELMAWIEIN